MSATMPTEIRKRTRSATWLPPATWDGPSLGWWRMVALIGWGFALAFLGLAIYLGATVAAVDIG